MRNCDLKWLPDSLAVNRANRAMEKLGGELPGLWPQPGLSFIQLHSTCQTRAREQDDLVCNMEKGQCLALHKQLV
jgi:hypothetical protein